MQREVFCVGADRLNDDVLGVGNEVLCDLVTRISSMLFFFS